MTVGLLVVVAVSGLPIHVPVAHDARYVLFIIKTKITKAQSSLTNKNHQPITKPQPQDIHQKV